MSIRYLSMRMKVAQVASNAYCKWRSFSHCLSPLPVYIDGYASDARMSQGVDAGRTPSWCNRTFVVTSLGYLPSISALLDWDNVKFFLSELCTIQALLDERYRLIETVAAFQAHSSKRSRQSIRALKFLVLVLITSLPTARLNHGSHGELASGFVRVRTFLK